MYQFFVEPEQIDVENKCVTITGGDVNHVNIFLLQHLGVVGVLLTAGIQIGDLGGTVGDLVAGGDDLELLGILAEFGFCHGPANTANAHEAKLDYLIHINDLFYS